ncbi:hypothetical protein J5N97_008110 [Dioscorea zingiberensis]|uniref:Exopolygalacturonase n=1 Tax=Dioscorea zingiberensis TaxID=325984 RepID=A0A9D5DER3_9LILI|nr:hypothetical protein J5N97_008110 [Dioscorea zingiberensis]
MDQYLSSKFIRVCLPLVLLSVVVNGKTRNGVVFNVKDFGAVANGLTNDTEAFDAAWKEACAVKGNATLRIPEGTYMVGPIMFEGPCNGFMEVQLKGLLLAPTNLSVFYPEYSRNWIEFRHLNNLLVHGGGILDGQGYSAWPSHHLLQLPYSLGFNKVINGAIRGISLVNSKNLHMEIFACQNFSVKSLTISAPQHSPNTDGIHIGRSTNITVKDTIIGDGDDCIAILQGSTSVIISNVMCGPGHGISVGSLGGRPREGDVVGLTVKNCTFTGTDNGLRIKTWQSSPSRSFVSDVLFQNILMRNVSNPIIIDQHYCPHGNCNPSTPSKVKISRVQFDNIAGTYRNPVAVKLVCSEDYPCSDVGLGDIDLEYIGDSKPEPNSCVNVQGYSNGNVKPASCI